jgi:hypothetical protein
MVDPLAGETDEAIGVIEGSGGALLLPHAAIAIAHAHD